MPISEHLKTIRAKIGSGLLQIPSVAAVIRDSDERILLALDAESGRWGLPSGAIDPGETPEQALEREVFEETGLRVEPLEVRGVFGGKAFRYVYSNGDQVEYLVVVFDCAIVGGGLRNRDGEVSELRFFSADQIPDLVLPYPESLF